MHPMQWNYQELIFTIINSDWPCSPFCLGKRPERRKRKFEGISIRFERRRLIKIKANRVSFASGKKELNFATKIFQVHLNFFRQNEKQFEELCSKDEELESLRLKLEAAENELRLNNRKFDKNSCEVSKK